MAALEWSPEDAKNRVSSANYYRTVTLGIVCMTHAVELEAVTKRFGSHVAVDRLDLAVPEGTVYGFIGPNGSGKTTTLRMILRILYPESGQVTVLGCSRGTAANDHGGYLPEERGLYRKMRGRGVLG